MSLSEQDRVYQAMTDLNEALEALWGPMEPLSIDDATGLWLAVRDEVAKIREFEALLEELLVNLMPSKEHATSYGRLEQKTSANKTTWDTGLLIPQIARAALIEQRANEDGEPLSTVEAICQAILECAAVSYFRLGKLDEYGIDGKKYREVEWGRKRVKLVPVDPSPSTD